jgi:hypothetical protein
MAVQAVGIGSSANDGTGDPLRTAFNKINENFTEVYSLLGQDVAGAKGIDISGSTIGSTETNADIIINPNGTGLVELAANVQIDNAILVNGSAISSLVTNADITLAPSGTGNINLTAGADVIIPANIGLTFGTGEKIEGDSTDLTVTSGGALNLTATTDIVIPTSVGILMAGTEKIESDGTDLTFTVGAGGDINIGTDIGLTFGNDGEKIEGDGTDLTIASSGDLNITNTGTMVISGSVKRALVTIAATDNITQIEHAGRVNLLGEVGGNALVTLTLPAATGSGLEYKFIVSVVNTSSYKIQVADATDTIDGSVNILDADANAQTAFVTAAASDTVTLNGTTSGGGSIGDTLTLTDIAANQYAIEGQLVCAAGSNPATPFTAAVS